MLETSAAILPSRNFDETVAFYAKIGFQVTGQWEDHQYLILCRDKVEVHFFGHKAHIPRTCDHGVYMRSTDVDAISADLIASDIPTDGIPRYVPADGNLLRIGQFLEVDCQ